MKIGFLSIDLRKVDTVSTGENYYGEIISGVKSMRSDKFFSIVTLFQPAVSFMIKMSNCLHKGLSQS